MMKDLESTWMRGKKGELFLDIYKEDCYNGEKNDQN